MRRTVWLWIVVSVALFCPARTEAWSVRFTHPSLSEKAAEFSVLSPARGDYLGRLGFTQNLAEMISADGEARRVKEWISYGAVQEDSGNVFTAQYYNHFHDPLRPWGGAGLGTIYPGISGRSSLLWAQDPANPWSWQRTREHFYSALVSSSDAGRGESFARTFKGLGHVIHLIQDAAQPAHVRNDPHPLDDMGVVPQFENWAKSPARASLVASLMASPLFPSVFLEASADPAYVPITQFWDTDQYSGTNPPGGTGTGIAEYAQANFFSEDTIQGAGFPHPAITPATPVVAKDYSNALSGTTYKRQYWLKDCCGETNGGQGYLLAAVDWLDYYRMKYPLLAGFLPKIPVLDNNVYGDYARFLIPRAAGYSAALIDHFFRLEMEISEVAPKKDDDGSITEVALRVKNAARTGESLSGGRFWLNARYRLSGATENSYRLSDEVPAGDIPAGNDPKDDAFKFTFSFLYNIPKDATNVQYTLAYRGPTKNLQGQVTEPDAVAGVVEKKDEVVLLVWGQNDPDLLGFDAKLNEIPIKESEYIKVGGLYPNRLQKLDDDTYVVGYGKGNPDYPGGWGVFGKHIYQWFSSSRKPNAPIPTIRKTLAGGGIAGDLNLHGVALSTHPMPPYAEKPWHALPWVGYYSDGIVSSTGSIPGGVFADWGFYDITPGGSIIAHANYYEAASDMNLIYSDQAFGPFPQQRDDMLFSGNIAGVNNYFYDTAMLDSVIVIRGVRAGHVASTAKASTVTNLVLPPGPYGGLIPVGDYKKNGLVDFILYGASVESVPIEALETTTCGPLSDDYVDRRTSGQIIVHAVSSGDDAGWGILYELQTDMHEYVSHTDYQWIPDYWAPNYPLFTWLSTTTSEITRKKHEWKLALSNGQKYSLSEWTSEVKSTSSVTYPGNQNPTATRSSNQTGEKIEAPHISFSTDGRYLLVSYLKRAVGAADGPPYSLSEYTIRIYDLQTGKVTASPLPASAHLERLASGVIVHGWRGTLDQ